MRGLLSIKSERPLLNRVNERGVWGWGRQCSTADRLVIEERCEKALNMDLEEVFRY